MHADECPVHDGALPARERSGGGRIVRGYGSNDRIVYGTGVVVENAAIETVAEEILKRPDVAYLHMRSAANNCFTLRIDRG